MIHSTTSGLSRLYHSLTQRSPAAATARNQPGAITVVAAQQGTEQARFVADFQKAVVRLDQHHLHALLRRAPTAHLQAALTTVIPVGQRHVEPGDTPLHVLASRHHRSSRAAEMTAMLLNHGANPNTRNESRQTPAMRAVHERQYRQLRVLVNSSSYDSSATMPRTPANAGAGDETLLEHAYRVDNYLAQEILENPRLLPQLRAARQVVPDTDEAGDVYRMLAQARNEPPAYSPELPPPSYDKVIETLAASAGTTDVRQGQAAHTSPGQQRRVSEI